MSSDRLSAERSVNVEMLRGWVARKAKGLPPEGLADDLPLLEGRYLTSLHIPELILLLEGLRGEAIDVERLQAGDFRDLRTIAARFLVGSPDPAAACAAETAPASPRGGSR
jgi:hypothetical protein